LLLLGRTTKLRNNFDRVGDIAGGEEWGERLSGVIMRES
jgi:hypothetical protein